MPLPGSGGGGGVVSRGRSGRMLLAFVQQPGQGSRQGNSLPAVGATLAASGGVVVGVCS